jgi:hypothetical protein
MPQDQRKVVEQRHRIGTAFVPSTKGMQTDQDHGLEHTLVSEDFVERHDQT